MSEPRVAQSATGFKGFNGLRFLAAYSVVLFHTEAIRRKYALFNLSGVSLFHNGGIAVEFFFVLSGFLITFLLLREHQSSGTVSIRNFYARRALRIWPLYYMILVTGLGLIPILMRLKGIEYSFPFPYGVAIPLYLFFLPNLVTTMYGSTFLYPLWSIGVEEQFYLVWAPLVKYSRTNFVRILLAIISGRVLLSTVFTLWSTSFSPAMQIVLAFLDTMKFESMAIGGLTAWALFRFRPKLIGSRVFHPLAQVALIAVILTRLLFDISLMAGSGVLAGSYQIIFGNGCYSTVVTSSLFAWLLVNISSNPRAVVSLENRVLDFLGTISYGIYMYHSIIVFGLILALRGILAEMNPIFASLSFHALVLSATVLVSWLSYRLIETRFLDLKRHFSQPSLARSHTASI